MIAFCHLLNDNSGSPVVLREVIRALTANGQGATLFVGSQGRGALEQAGVPIRRYWYRRSRFRAITLVTYIASQIFLYRALAKARLPVGTIIYANTLLPFGAALWARCNGCKLIYHVHEVSLSPAILQRFLVRVVERTADRVIYVSADNRRRLPMSNVGNVVIWNPVSKKIQEAGNHTAYRPRRSGCFRVLMLSSLRDYKGLPEFLALSRRLAARQDIQFTLVMNADKAEIETYFKGSAIGSNVQLHGRIDDPERFYAKADIVLNLTRPDMVVETFGLTIVEAMAFGLPVIVPPVGGPAEIVTDGQEGYLIDSTDSKSLETRVLQLADSPKLAMQMSVHARERSRSFTLARFSEALQAQVNGLLPRPVPEQK